MIRRAMLVLVLFAGAGAAAAPAPSVGPSPPAPSTRSLAAPQITPTSTSSDTCGATVLAGLIGQSRAAIPIPDDISKRRVVCTTCPRSLEYRADRLTIFYDAPSGRVTTLQCG